MNLVKAFLRRDFNIDVSYKLSFILQLIGTIFQITLFYFLAKFIGTGATSFLKPYGGSYFAFVLIGIAYQTYFSMSLSGYSNKLRQDQMLGTLEMMLLSPYSGQRIFILSASYDMVFTSIRILIYILIGALFFGLDVSQANIPACILFLFLTILSFSGLGILSAAFILMIKRGDPVVWLFTMANTLFGGVYFTPEVLPHSLQFLSLLLPMTHSLYAFRQALLNGTGIGTLLPQAGILLLFSVFTIPLGYYAFRVALYHTKRAGTLSQY